MEPSADDKAAVALASRQTAASRARPSHAALCDLRFRSALYAAAADFCSMDLRPFRNRVMQLITNCKRAVSWIWPHRACVNTPTSSRSPELLAVRPGGSNCVMARRSLSHPHHCQRRRWESSVSLCQRCPFALSLTDNCPTFSFPSTTKNATYELR